MNSGIILIDKKLFSYLQSYRTMILWRQHWS